ncbi:hypothetical protein TRFO_18434 [Tritrichomonas foetus]|uniref:Glycosyltransferase 2-like domain-containing protein n=1 Tax=Tritrichomonas foetus TaxID=1144522 RepID=A0A1J4KQ82_9EUKA|nr:hypothetical protein TRFO_18434 [Tritrichomonas foetus]|eukprot:OHT11948.1 hypothetical protein TRFO_18434 [Tritrichomonas foetus]
MIIKTSKASQFNIPKITNSLLSVLEEPLGDFPRIPTRSEFDPDIKIAKPNQKYLITIVFCIFNKHRFLPKVFESLLNESYFNRTEILFVDDFSSDNSPDLLKNFSSHYPNVNYVRNDKNRGILGTRIVGAFQSSGEYMMSFVPDDEIIEGAIEFIYKMAIKYNTDIITYERNIANFQRSIKIEGNTKTEEIIRLIQNNNTEIFDIFAKGQIYYGITTSMIRTSLIQASIMLIPKDIREGYYIAGEDLLLFGLVARYAKTLLWLKNTVYIYNCNAPQNHVAIKNPSKNSLGVMHNEMCQTLVNITKSEIDQSYYA